MEYGNASDAVDCILQDYVDGGPHGRDAVRCWFLFGDCVPSHQCPERMRLSAGEIEAREREDRGE